jgi:protein TonB
VLRFGSRAVRTGLIFGGLIATLSHGAFAARALAAPVDMRLWAEHARQQTHAFLWTTHDIEIIKPAAPEPDKKPEEPKQQPAEEQVAKPLPQAPAAPPPEPPPAAQAGKLLTAPEDPDQPLDLTGNGFVTGEADSYIGGVTAPAATGSTATYNPAASPTGKPGGTATTAKPASPQVEGPSLARAARPSSTEWSSCPFPAEADIEQVDYAVVTLIVTVRVDGTPRSVQVLSDPGHGFGRAARMCALSRRYEAALDRQGLPIVGSTPPFRVSFTR